MFSDDGTRIASASEDGTVRVWDPATQREISEMKSPLRNIWGIAFSADGKQIASTPFDTGQVWETATGSVPGTFEKVHDRTFFMRTYGDRAFSKYALAFSGDNKFLAAVLPLKNF